MNKDLLWIKKHYNEKFAHLCRELFPTLLETEGLLPKLIDSYFDHSKFLYDDIVNNCKVNEFKTYIYSLANIGENHKVIDDRTPKELLESVGYDLYECKTEEDIQSFKKYYAPGEELCTFKTRRLDNCYVFFAVKKDVDNIRRENFKRPQRQDEYGTSVISIQFSKGKNNVLSIKNRYNHRVDNPDATFNNNLDNIVYGLSDSFAREYNLKFITDGISNFYIPNYIQCNDGKFYRYNYEINNIYYCVNNVIVENFDSELSGRLNNHCLLVDYFIIDLKEKTITSRYKDDLFTDSITDCGKIEKIECTKNKDKGMIIDIYIENEEKPIVITTDKYGRITGYVNNIIQKVGRHFLCYNQVLNYIEMNNAVNIGYDFLSRNTELRKISFPNLVKVDTNFLDGNEVISEVELPLLERIGHGFLEHNLRLESIELPSVRTIENYFLSCNKGLKKIVMPCVERIGDSFCFDNEAVEEIDMPLLQEIGDSFLYYNSCLKHLELPSVKKIRLSFLFYNKLLNEISLPKIESVFNNFLASNTELKRIDFPCLMRAGEYFISNNTIIEEVNLPSLEIVGNSFLERNNKVKRLELPSIIEIGNDFMAYAEFIEELVLPKVERIGRGFLFTNHEIRKLDFPCLTEIKRDFMPLNKCIEEINIPVIDYIESIPLIKARGVKSIKLPPSPFMIDCFLHVLSDSYSEEEKEKIITYGSIEK